MISCGARLAPFDIPQLREIMSYDELELDRIGYRKTAVFFIISDTTQTYSFLVALAFSQMFNLLCERAGNVHGGRLPHHVRVLWDEAANTGQVPQLEKIVAVIRSREISLTLFYQQLAQCKAIYDKHAETILGNMDSVVFLGGREASTIKEISENWRERPPSVCRPTAALVASRKATARTPSGWAGFAGYTYAGNLRTFKVFKKGQYPYAIVYENENVYYCLRCRYNYFKTGDKWYAPELKVLYLICDYELVVEKNGIVEETENYDIVNLVDNYF